MAETRPLKMARSAYADGRGRTVKLCEWREARRDYGESATRMTPDSISAAISSYERATRPSNFRKSLFF